MQKNSITNKITPCCGLPFSVVHWWVSNLTLNSENDRQFILSSISQNGTLSIDGWKVLINSGTLEADASLTKAEFLEWFDCGKQPNCEQLKLIIEGLVLGSWTPEEIIVPKYNDENDTTAVDILRRIEKNTGVDINYKEVTTWKDGSPMTDAKLDGVIYIKKNSKYYVLTDFIAGLPISSKMFKHTDGIINSFFKTLPNIVIRENLYLDSTWVLGSQKVEFENATLTAKNFQTESGQLNAMILLNSPKAHIKGATLDGAENSAITGITISNGADDSIVENTLVKNILNHTAFMVHANNVNRVKFINCLAENSKIGYGVEKWDYGTGNPKNILFENCFSKNTGYGFYGAGATVTIRNCEFQSNQWVGGFFYIGDAKADFSEFNLENVKFNHFSAADVGIKIYSSVKDLELIGEYAPLVFNAKNVEVISNGVGRPFEMEASANVNIDGLRLNGGSIGLMLNKDTVNTEIIGKHSFKNLEITNCTTYYVETHFPVIIENLKLYGNTGVTTTKHGVYFKAGSDGSKIMNYTLGASHLETQDTIYGLMEDSEINFEVDGYNIVNGLISSIPSVVLRKKSLKNITPLSVYDSNLKKSGTTAERPSTVILGFPFFDTTINKNIYWNGGGWVDALGSVV